MRFLLIFLMAGGLYAEAVPFLEMTYVAGDGLEPSAPVDAWWKRTLTDSQVWCASRIEGIQLEPPRSVHVRITAHTDVLGRAMPGWSASWIGPLPEVAKGAIERRVATWKDFRCQVATDAFTLADSNGVLDLPRPEHGAGWRLTVHGSGIDLGADQELATNPAYEDRRDQVATQDFRALIRKLSVSAGLDPSPGGPLAWIDAGLRASWFRPIDQALIDRIPADALAAAAIGIDGATLAEAIGGLPDSLRLAMGLGAMQAGIPLDPVAAARSADGTWIAYGSKRTFLIRMPRSQLLDLVMAMMARIEQKNPPKDEAPARLTSDVVWARDDREWLFADSVESIQSWRAAKPGGDLAIHGGRPQAGSRVWLVAREEAVAKVMGKTLYVLMPELPLSLLQPHAAQIMDDLGITRPVDALLSAELKQCLSRVRIGDQVVGDRLRLTLQGGALPWILPGLGIAWCAATIQEQEGRIALSTHLAVERAAGRPATPGDLIAALPEPAVNEAAIIAGLAKLRNPVPSLNDLWKRYLADGTVLAKDQADPTVIAALDQLVEDSAFIDGVSPENIAYAALRSEALAGRRGIFRQDLAIKPGQNLAQAGRCLVAFGDTRGLLLVERARILIGKPNSLIDCLIQSVVAARRDDAFIVGGLAGVLAEAQIQAWLTEKPLRWYAEGLRLEAIATPGVLAEIMLEASSKPVSGALGGFELHSSLLTPASLRGSMHDDLLTSIDFLRWLADDTKGKRPAIENWRSRLPGLIIPAVSMIRAKEREAALRHQVMRLALRLHRAGPFPDHATAVAAVGPLTISIGDGTVSLVYSAVPTGFTLAPDPAAKPDGFSDYAWKKLLETAPVGEAAVSLPARGMSVRLSRGQVKVPAPDPSVSEE